METDHLMGIFRETNLNMVHLVGLLTNSSSSTRVTKDQVKDYCSQQALSLLNTKKDKGVKTEKERGFCFAVDKACPPLSPLFCRLAGSISDWVQDQKQELFLQFLRQTKALTLLSPLLSFSSPLSLSSLNTLSLLQMPIEYTSEYLTHSLLLLYFLLCVFLSSKHRTDRSKSHFWQNIFYQNRLDCLFHFLEQKLFSLSWKGATLHYSTFF